MILPNRSAARSGIRSSLVVEEYKTDGLDGSGNKVACRVFCEQINACRMMMMKACTSAVEI